MSSLLKQSIAGLRVLLVLTVLLGVCYPLGVWAVSRSPGLHAGAEGAVTTDEGHPVGSAHIGIDPVPANPAHDPYFHDRPSASSRDVLGPADTSTSGGSNLAGDSRELLATVAARGKLIAAREGVAVSQVPADAVTASGSGLDPDISPAYAALQVRRVATENGLSPDRVRSLVAAYTSPRALGFLGEPAVNVLELNLAVRAAAG